MVDSRKGPYFYYYDIEKDMDGCVLNTTICGNLRDN